MGRGFPLGRSELAMVNYMADSRGVLKTAPQLQSKYLFIRTLWLS